MKNSNSPKGSIMVELEYLLSKEERPLHLVISFSRSVPESSLERNTAASNDAIESDDGGLDADYVISVRSRHALSLEREDQRFRKAIVTGLLCNATIDSLAQICCLSASTFKRRFRDRFSASPHCWFMEQRLRIARRLLSDTSLSISDLSLACGFTNLSHFISQFRRRYNITPSCLRRSMCDMGNSSEEPSPLDVEVKIKIQDR